ncbi:MAG: queuosine precursor transporter [Desulfurococcales archaeon]|nr:queuosine precursor transporter [Desulfurococcales archaeon]
MEEKGREWSVLVFLSALFAVSLISANFLSSKVFSFRVFGIEIAGPAGVVAYSATFLVTDIVSEVYGRRVASTVVKAGFLAQLAAVLYTMAALQTPAAPYSPVSSEVYASVVWAGWAIIIASLTAYIVSQVHDVWAFHFWKALTGGRWLWLRNNASTIVSQAIDTVIFITLAFNILPRLAGGTALPLDTIVVMIYSQYLIKVAIALLDTPLAYLGVALVRAYTSGAPGLDGGRLLGLLRRTL